MTEFGSSSSLTIIYSNEATLKTIIDLARDFGLSSVDGGKPECEVHPDAHYVVLANDTGEIDGQTVTSFRDGIEELHGFGSAVLHAHPNGNNVVAAMEVHLF